MAKTWVNGPIDFTLTETERFNIVQAPEVPAKKKRLTPQQKKALDKYRFASAQEDRYLGSVFVNPLGQRDHEARVKQAYDECKRLGLGMEHGL